MQFQAPMNYVASGAVKIGSFVKLDPTLGKNHYVLQAVAGDFVYGIAWENTFDPQGVNGANTTDAAKADGDMVPVFSLAHTCRLKAGTGGYLAGQYLKPDANGYGIVALPGQPYGAIALEDAAAGVWGRVVVDRGITPSLAPFTVNADTVLTASQLNTTIFVTGSRTLTLPTAASAAGLTVIVVNNNSAGTSIKVDPAGSELIKGNGFTAAAGKHADNTAGTARQGDVITLVSNGTDWFITEVSGTWAREA
jgi:hypothetical protein